jgi:hypothetical protein
LAGADVQAQDGLGTCASNALSLMLQGALPGHPEVSFLDIAFHDEDVGEQALVDPALLAPVGTPPRKLEPLPPELAFTGAHICGQFEAVMKSGGACPREFVALEAAVGESKEGGRAATFRSDDLQRALEGIGRLFDAGLGTPEGNRLWESEILPMMVLSEGRVLQACSGRLAGEEGLAGVFAEMATEVRVTLESQLGTISRYEQALSDLVKAGKAQEAAVLRAQLEMHRGEVAQLQAAAKWLEDPPLTQIEAAFYSRYERSRSQFDRLAHLDEDFEVFDAKVTGLMGTWLRESIPAGAPVSDQKLEEFLEFSPDSVRKLRLQLLAAANPKSCALHAYSDFRFNPERGFCQGGEMRDPVLELLAAYVDIGLSSEGWVRDLPQARTSEDATDWFMRTLAPGCIGPANRIPIDASLACQDSSWTPPQVDQLSDPVSRQAGVDAFVTQVRAGLTAGRAQGISMCSAVLRDFSYDGEHDLNGGCSGATALPGHGHHAVVVIGMRETPDAASPGGCKREVLVQNSWGLDWCSAHNQGIERKEDQPCQDGKLWMPAEALARNAYLLSEIGRVETLPAKK